MVLKSTLGFFLCCFLFVSCSSKKSDVSEMDDEDNSAPMEIEEARTVYTVNCASCHGGDGALKGSNSADLTISKLSDKKILEMINKGNDKGMMPYRDILSQRERDGLVKFVKSLRK